MEFWPGRKTDEIVQGMIRDGRGENSDLRNVVGMGHPTNYLYNVVAKRGAKDRRKR